MTTIGWLYDEAYFYGSSDKQIGDAEGSFLPFWIHLAYTVGAKTERKHRMCRPSIYIEKPRNGVPLLR